MKIKGVIEDLKIFKKFKKSKRKEKGERGDRGDLVEKKESPKGERAIKPVISLPSKNRYWRLGS